MGCMTTQEVTTVDRVDDGVELRVGPWRFTWGRDDALDIAHAMIEAVAPRLVDVSP